jgi:hypothetical protein
MKSAVNTAGAENFEKKFGSFLFVNPGKLFSYYLGNRPLLHNSYVILHKLNGRFFAAAPVPNSLAFKKCFPYSLDIIHLQKMNVK